MEIHRSARRHGVRDDAIDHALEHAIVVADLEPDADPPRILAIGPDPAGNLLEIIWLELVEDRQLVVHSAAPRVLRPTARGGRLMTKPKTHTTRSGRTLTDADIEAIADEVAAKDYDVETLKTRRRGRPPFGSGPAGVVPVRIDPELRAAIERRAKADNTTTSEVIREAIRRFLDVA